MPRIRRIGIPLLGFALLLVSVAVWSPAHASTVEGEVFIRQPGASSGEQEVDDRSNAVVFVAGFTEPPPKDRGLELAQENKSFSERVLALTQGESVDFPNHDPFHHNVWSKSKARPFDLGLFKAPESRTVDFPNPGIITVFCNIHAQMISTILVLPNRRFAVTDKSGKFRIEGVPAGKHNVFAWVEGSTPVRKLVEFRDGNTAKVDFRLQLKRIPLDHLNKEGKPYSKKKPEYVKPIDP